MVSMHGKQFWKHNILWILLLFLLGIAVYWQSLLFTFSKDDWGLLWGSLHDLSIYNSYAIHPATPIEFFILSHIFGTNPFGWQVFGIFLRVLIGFVGGCCMFALTQSKKVGILSAIFITVCFAGLESINFVSGHATALSLIFLLGGFYVWIRFITKKSKSITGFVVLSLIGFVLDPGRALPFFVILPLSFFFFSKRIVSVQRIKKYLIIFLPIAMIILSIFIAWYTTQSTGSQFAIFLNKFFHSPVILVKKFYLVGNYFGSIGNLLTGWIIPNMQDAQNTGVYNKIIARLAVIVFLATCGSCYMAIKQKSTRWKIISFFLVWIFLWYIPDWLFEPRTPMAGSHRYLLMSGVGLSMLLAYLISFVKSKFLFFAVAGFILIANIATIQGILAYQKTFRSQESFQHIWQKVEREVGNTPGPQIFVFTGKYPYEDMIAGLSGGFPFALEKGIDKQQNLPMLTNDPAVIVRFLCTTGIPLSHVFAWDILSPTQVRSYTNEERAFLQAYARAKGCDL